MVAFKILSNQIVKVNGLKKSLRKSWRFQIRFTIHVVSSNSSMNLFIVTFEKEGNRNSVFAMGLDLLITA